MSSSVETPAPGLLELARIMEQMRTLHGAALTVIADLARTDVARTAGYASLSALIADLLRITPRRAARLIG